METETTLKKRRSMRKAHFYVAIAVWVTMLGSVGLYWLFVWLSVWRPHIAWWWLTAGLVVLSAVTSFCLMVYQLFGRDRIRGIGVFMISVVPLVWLATFLWSTINVLNTRQELSLSDPIRSLGLWVTSYFELEARWRYQRFTEGKHAMLFDDGTAPDVDALVASMDTHIEQMAAALETPIPKVKARWVRGTLFGQNARAVGAWAITDVEQDLHQLDYLDRHEVAHVTLTTMCPVSQEMPMLFAEGWAQSQSVDPAKAILRLNQKKQNGDALTLNEIVTNSYGCSTGPAYDHGGPLVTYLLERFGGAKFVELYGGVRRKTFPQDVQRITGVAWDQLEEDFWVWLESRHEWAKSSVKEAAESSISFDREQDQPLWQEILASARKASKSIVLPDNVAFVEAATSKTRDGKPWSSEGRFVFEGDCMWKFYHQKSEPPITQFQIATPEASGRFMRQGNKIVSESSWHSSYKEATSYTKSSLFNYSRLARVLMLDPNTLEANEGQKIQVLSIESKPDSPLWKLCFTTTFGSANGKPQKQEAMLDSNHFFDVVELVEEREGKRRVHKYETGSIQGTPFVTRRTITDDKGESFKRTLSVLAPEEATQVKQEVETAFASVVNEPVTAKVVEPENWRNKLITPLVLAISWPLLGIVFLLIDFLCDLVRWRVS